MPIAKKKTTQKKSPKTKQTKTEVIPKIPPEWKAMDKLDAKISKLTSNLIVLVEEGIKTIAGMEDKEKSKNIKADLDDYCQWLQKLNKDIEKFSRWGRS